MSEEKTVPFDGLKHIEKVLLTLDSIPLLGHSPTLAWDQLSAKISQSFGVEGISIESQEQRWVSGSELLEGLAEPISPIQIKLSPLEGDAYWMIHQGDIEKLLGWLLKSDSGAIPEGEEDLAAGFYRFLALKAASLVEELGATPALSPTLSFTGGVPEGDALVRDIQLSFGSHNIFGRFAITPTLQQSMKRHFTPKKPLHVTSDMAKNIDLTIHLEAGRTEMMKEEWSQVACGDFLLLDSYTVEPDGSKQKVMLTVRGKPVFRGRIKDGQLKILEYPILTEVQSGMENDEFDDDEMTFDEEEDFDLDDEEEDFDLDDDEEGFDEDEEDNEKIPEPEEDELEEESIDAPDDMEDEEEASPADVAAEAVGATAATSGASAQELVKPDQIPMNIIVELGRVQMNAQTLMELQPGNMLDVSFDPNQGVDLVVNGKPVGRGELIKVGEQVGVRVLNLA